MVAVVLLAALREASIARDDQHDAGEDPPPGGHTEEVQHQIGEPRANVAALVAQDFAGAGKRPAGIALLVGRENQCKVGEQRDDQE